MGHLLRHLSRTVAVAAFVLPALVPTVASAAPSTMASSRSESTMALSHAEAAAQGAASARGTNASRSTAAVKPGTAGQAATSYVKGPPAHASTQGPPPHAAGRGPATREPEVAQPPAPDPAPLAEPEPAAEPVPVAPIEVADPVPAPESSPPPPTLAPVLTDAVAAVDPIVDSVVEVPVAVDGPGGTFADMINELAARLPSLEALDLRDLPEPVSRMVPMLLGLLGAFLALQRGIGRGLGHVPMAVSGAPPRPTVRV